MTLINNILQDVRDILPQVQLLVTAVRELGTAHKSVGASYHTLAYKIADPKDDVEALILGELADPCYIIGEELQALHLLEIRLLEHLNLMTSGLKNMNVHIKQLEEVEGGDAGPNLN